MDGSDVKWSPDGDRRIRMKRELFRQVRTMTWSKKKGIRKSKKEKSWMSMVKKSRVKRREIKVF